MIKVVDIFSLKSMVAEFRGGASRTQRGGTPMMREGGGRNHRWISLQFPLQEQALLSEL